MNQSELGCAALEKWDHRFSLGPGFTRLCFQGKRGLRLIVSIAPRKGNPILSHECLGFKFNRHHNLDALCRWKTRMHLPQWIAEKDLNNTSTDDNPIVLLIAPCCRTFD